ncbi:MAG: hypothetical protein QOD75_4018 [Blastocatellia bacterium]|jgi:hypothetical protein|nr:hypothetical protein [Blastocatellia bacterium]
MIPGRSLLSLWEMSNNYHPAERARFTKTPISCSLVCSCAFVNRITAIPQHTALHQKHFDDPQEAL